MNWPVKMVNLGWPVKMVDVSFVPREALATVVDFVDAMLNQSDSGFLLLYPRTRNQGRKQITVNLIEQLITHLVSNFLFQIFAYTFV